MTDPKFHYSGAQLRRIASILDLIEAADPPDSQNPTGIYIEGPITVQSNDDGPLGAIVSHDGFWGFEAR